MSNLFTTYTYGGGDVLHAIFNVIAIIYQDGYLEQFFQISIMLGLAVAGIKASATQKPGTHYIRWFMGYLFVILILMQPVTMFGNKGMTMYWRDVVTGKAGKVDHLPPGLVAPAGVTSGMGYSVTKIFETLFASPMPEYLPYYKYGTTFASQVRSDLKEMRIQDPIFSENLESYINNCVKYDSMIGNIYDIRDLANSPNIWQFLEEHSSNLRMFNYRLPDRGGRELVACRVGLKRLATSFNKEAELLAKKFPGFAKLMHSREASDINAKNGFLKALEVTGKFYGNVNGSASEQLKQILFINQFKTNPHSYGTVRGMQAQNSNWMVLGDIGQLALPILHSIFQGLIYASFSIVVTILFFSQRWQTLKTYFEMMIWIELWPILFAVLNGSVSIFARRAGIDEVITINSIDNIVNTQSMYAMMAYGMGLSIPAFAYMITKGGVGQFVHMAGSLMSATQQGASMASTELATGNRSLDNVSVGNQSYNNVSGNKYDTSGLSATGFMRNRLADGTMMTENMYSDSHGGRIFQTGQGMTESSGSVVFSKVQNLVEQDEDRLGNMMQNIQSEKMSVTNAQKQAESSSASWMLRNYANILQDKSSIIKKHGQDGEKLVEIAGKVKQVSENYDYSKEQSGSVGISGKVGAGTPSGKGGILSAAADLMFGANASSTDKQGLSEMARVNSTKQTDKMLEVMNQYSKENSLRQGEGAENSDTKTFNNSYDTYKQKQGALESMQSESRQLQQSIASIKSRSFMASEAGIQGFINYFASRGDQDSVFENATYGDRKAVEHILKRDDVFKSMVKRYTAQQEGANYRKIGEDSYLAEKYSKGSNFSNNIENKIQKTNIEDKTSSTTPPAQFFKKPEVPQDNNIEQYIDKKLFTNQTKIKQQERDTSNANTDLENKVNAADKSTKGYFRNEGWIGTPNQFVKTRNHSKKDDSKK